MMTHELFLIDNREKITCFLKTIMKLGIWFFTICLKSVEQNTLSMYNYFRTIRERFVHSLRIPFLHVSVFITHVSYWYSVRLDSTHFYSKLVLDPPHTLDLGFMEKKKHHPIKSGSVISDAAQVWSRGFYRLWQIKYSSRIFKYWTNLGTTFSFNGWANSMFLGEEDDEVTVVMLLDRCFIIIGLYQTFYHFKMESWLRNSVQSSFFIILFFHFDNFTRCV